MTTFFTDRDLGNAVPDLLAAGGIRVERHSAHFVHNAEDVDWISGVAEHGWCILTHDKNIGLKPNERAAVMLAGVGMFVLVGKMNHADLAKLALNTVGRMEVFLSTNPPPFIAKVYRPSPSEVARNPNAPGTVKMWRSD